MLINNLPTPLLQFKTPYELLYLKKPNYQFFKAFGCACYPYLRPYPTHKFNFHTSKCVFIGYSIHHKGYKCLHPSGRVYLSKHVIFNEFDFPFKALFHSSSSQSQFSAPPQSGSSLHHDNFNSSHLHSNVDISAHFDSSNVGAVELATLSHSWHILLPTEAAPTTSR
ncbi:hypothetical protein ACOSQ2_014079 [Xanthoceras sorbifolium]